MSDVNAVPAEVTPEAPATAGVTPEVAAVQAGEPLTSAASPSSPEPVVDTVGETSTAVAPSTEVTAAPSVHESLLARIEGLPAEGVTLLHDVLNHVREGVDEFALTIGLGRLYSLFEKVKSRL